MITSAKDVMFSPIAWLVSLIMQNLLRLGNFGVALDKEREPEIFKRRELLTFYNFFLLYYLQTICMSGSY